LLEFRHLFWSTLMQKNTCVGGGRPVRVAALTHIHNKTRTHTYT